MSSISDIIDRKFIDEVKNDEWEILTDTGWSDFDYVLKTIPYKKWKLILEDNTILECADTHIIFDENLNEIFVKDVKINKSFVITKNGPKLVIGLINTHEEENMYDISLLDKNHRFYTNNILSHNTTAITCIMLWHILFNENWNGAILANKLKTATKILTRIKFAYSYLPMWLQQGIVEWNMGNIKLENGSVLYASSTTPSGIRGDSTNLVYLDEFAIVDDHIQEEFYSATYPTISSGESTKMIITSTPQGLDLFYKLWVESEQGRNPFKRVDIHWTEIAGGKDDEWKKNQIKIMGDRMFEQEFGTEFLGSSATLISGKALRKMVPIPNINPMTADEDGHFMLYEWPKDKRLYIITVDTATGINKDYSAFIVFDATETPYKIVAVYKNNTIPVVAFPTVINRWAMRYNNAYILTEINANLGTQVNQILHEDFEYENIIWTKNHGRNGRTVSSGFGDSGSKAEMGINTTKVTKSIGCSNLKTLVERDQLPVQDYWLINELARFSQKGSSYAAEDGNDDLAMCLVIFAWLVAQNFIKDLNNVDFRQKLLEDKAHLIEEDLVPFGLIVDGQEHQDEGNIDQDGNIINIDRWLLE